MKCRECKYWAETVESPPVPPPPRWKGEWKKSYQRCYFRVEAVTRNGDWPVCWHFAAPPIVVPAETPEPTKMSIDGMSRHP